jgi:3-methylfumaryl-CoA hydratase
MRSLAAYIEDWSPPAEDREDDLHPGRAAALAATLDLDESRSPGDALPLLWHWAYFLDWPKTDQLGPDGHPAEGRFLPPIPNRRRMFAGSHVDVAEQLQFGKPTVRHSTVANMVVKRGRSGELLFITVRHEYRQSGRVKLVEEQDLVYRSDDGRSAPAAPRAEPLEPSTAPWQMQPKTSPSLLFRFSAVTGNSHRIHYDKAYASGVEGFPDLVVHGPLLGLYMAELLRANGPEPVAHFGFRLRRPVFVGDAVRVHGTPVGRTAELAVMSGASSVHATATATFG